MACIDRFSLLPCKLLPWRCPNYGNLQRRRLFIYVDPLPPYQLHISDMPPVEPPAKVAWVDNAKWVAYSLRYRHTGCPHRGSRPEVKGGVAHIAESEHYQAVVMRAYLAITFHWTESVAGDTCTLAQVPSGTVLITEIPPFIISYAAATSTQ